MTLTRYNQLNKFIFFIQFIPIRNMELEQLKAFVAIADHGSFSAAAQALFLTQPAVSKRLAALEEEWEVKLFDRVGRQARLSSAGSSLLPKARELLLQAQDLKHLASHLQQQVRGPLLLGTSHHIGLHRLPPLLKRYRSQYPEVALDIRFLDSEAGCRAVEKGELELAVVTLPPQTSPRLRSRLLWHDPLLFVASREHPLAGQKHISLPELVRFPAVLPAGTTFTRGILEQALNAQQCYIRVSMSTNYMETLKMLADINLGWSLLPATMVDDSLCVLDLPLSLERQLGIVTHRKRSLSNPARALLELLP